MQLNFPFNLVPIVFVFIVVPVLDFVIGRQPQNPNALQELKWRSSLVWGPLLFLYFLTHFFLLGYALYLTRTIDWFTLIILSFNIGLYTGGLGITVAHELSHKKHVLFRMMGDILLSSVCYQHFSVEHIRGHHFQVATPNDPASARRNEPVYFFLCRTIIGSFFHAYSLDKKKVISGFLLSIFFIFLAFFISLKTGILFITQSIVAIILLELVNYVEHYGLVRKQMENGKYEKVLPVHSWNSSHLFSNLILFNLQRHSDHHANAHLPYTVLKNHESAPDLPTGYPGMILLALIPPFWFKLMNSKLDNKFN
jgi:alkane 1-monooxygenase